MKPVRLAAILILGVTMFASLAASADEPSTRPAQRAGPPLSTAGPVANPVRLRRALLALIAGRTANVRPYTQQEWDDMMAFMQENSPARGRVLANLHVPNNSPVRLDAIRKWRNYNFTKEHFPAVADQLLRRFKLEDDLFALTLTAQAEGEAGVAQMRDKIRGKIADMVQLDFSERQTRIDKLQKMLEEEKARLASDQASQDKLIDQRTNLIMNRLDKLSRASAPTTRPDGEDAADENPAATMRDPIVNVSKGTDSK
ncbi:MAG: hypothetical protein ABSC42_03270 [Tepidisphaeraceae bacterium]|jgi:Asp-tRNA(Asn)/Glu-tRNA(Gln) amidotransferase A subunit family amidase